MSVGTMIKIGDLVRWDDGRSNEVWSYGIVLRLCRARSGEARDAQVRWEATSCGRWKAAIVWEPIDGLLLLSNTTKEIK